MPNYNSQVPPFTLYPGDTGLAFNSENPSAPQASQQFAMGVPYGTVPASISLELSSREERRAAFNSTSRKRPPTPTPTTFKSRGRHN
jgi:hypothetical protein